MRMLYQNKVLFLGYKLLILGLSAYGLWHQIFFANGIDYSSFYDYTTLSNILVFLYFLGSVIMNLSRAIQGIRMRTFLPQGKGALLLLILMTMLVYHFILLPEAEGSLSLTSLLLQYVLPVMTLLDWVLFDRKGQFVILDPFRWLLLPMLYFLMMVVRALLGGPIRGESYYPYFFIDVDLLGWRAVWSNVGMLALIFLAIGLLIWLIDHLWGRWIQFSRKRTYKEKIAK